LNILITGIHGFVGSNLTNALKSRYSIFGLDIIASDQNGIVKTCNWHDLEQGLLPSVDVIIHLAGKASNISDRASDHVDYSINLELTIKIYEFFLKSTASKFIFFSSVKAVADSTMKEDVLTEDSIPEPKGLYGKSKLLAEQYIQKHWPENGSDKHVYILRPCMIHGPENKGNLNLLCKMVNKGIPWPLGSFKNHRSFTSIWNICYIIEELIAKDIPSGIYHIADDETLSTDELFEIICDVLKMKKRIWYIPKPIVKAIANIGCVIRLPLNPERLHKLSDDYVVSNTRIKKVLGIDHMPVSAKDGLRNTIRSFRM
jgi:nucleoside-diphosphate-sugar epimerase